MTTSVSSVVDPVLSLVQAAQGGFEVGNSSNSYNVFTNALNLAGTLAGQGPWAPGINSAAAVNNSISVLSSFQTGTLQPSEVLQVTGSALSLAVAAAAIAGVPVTTSALVLAGVVGIVAGPGPLQDQFNEYANKIAQILSQNALSSNDIDEQAIANTIGSSGSGGSIIVRQYDYGNSNELATFQFIDNDGTRSYQVGVASGVETTYILPPIVVRGSITANGDPNFTSYNGYATLDGALNNALNNATIVSSYAIPASDSQLGYATNFVNSNLSYSGNTADFADGLLNSVGFSQYSLFNFVQQYSNLYLQSNSLHGLTTTPYDTLLNDSLGDPYYYDYWTARQILGESIDEPFIDGFMGSFWGDGGSPIVLDLDNNGLWASDYRKFNVEFDIDGDGTTDRTSWISPTDGFVALDHNHNGTIDDVNELFGSLERGIGYKELSELDSDGDGLIRSNDTLFNDLLIWTDVDSNGKSSPTELFKLDELGVSEINLNYTTQENSINGNLIGEASTATMNGATIAAGDIYFRYSQNNTPSSFGPEHQATTGSTSDEIQIVNHLVRSMSQFHPDRPSTGHLSHANPPVAYNLLASSSCQ